MTGFKLRQRPDDFREQYIKLGRDGAIQHYGTHKKVINRWVGEEGSEGIRQARADYVASNRVKRPQKAAKPVIKPHDREDLAAACAWFRENRNGGWRCAINADGMAYRGSRIMQPVELIAMAFDKGMDEWYVEADIMKRLALSEGIDEWVIEKGGFSNAEPFKFYVEEPKKYAGEGQRVRQFTDMERGVQGREELWFDD